MAVKYDENTIKDFSFANTIEHLNPIPHVHTFWEIVYPMFREDLVQYVNEKKIVVSNDSFLIMKPGDVHYFLCYNPERFIKQRNIFVEDEKMKEICGAIDGGLYEKLIYSTDPVIVPFGHESSERLEKRWNIFSREDVPKDKLKAIHTTLVAYYLGLYVEKQISSLDNYPDWLLSLLANLSKPEFMTKDISEIVKSTNYSHGFVCREFKKYLGITLVRYVLDERLRASSVMLMDKNKAMVEIAMECGFCSQSNYINAFKKLFKITPAAWRKNYVNLKRKS